MRSAPARGARRIVYAGRMLAPGARWPRMLDRLPVPAMLVLALVLRLREALRTPLWFDELHTLEAAGRPWPDFLRIVRADVHPPLPALLARGWRVFGDTDLAVRSYSILFALTALGIGYLLARRLFGRPSALLALLLVALHPGHVYLSEEARSYPLLFLALTLAWWSAWRWCEDDRRGDAVAFVLASALALWTHYLAGVLLAILATWGVVRLARTPQRLAAWLGLQAAVLVLFAPLLPLFVMQFHRLETEHWLPPPGLSGLLHTVRTLAFGRPRLMIPLIALALVPLFATRTRRAAGFVATIGPLAVIVCWMLGMLGIRVFFTKYMLFAVAPLLMLVAAGVMRLPGRVLRATVATGLAGFAALQLAHTPPYAEAASLGMVRERLAGRVQPGDLMFHSDAHVWLFGRRYFPAARHRLLSMGQPMPYYDGRSVTPDSALGESSEMRDAGAQGRRWWALAFGRGAVTASAFGACADSFAAAPPDTCYLVRVWSGGPAR